MIHVYALEPGLLNTWERFRYLTEHFGVSNGRLISRYPRRWTAMVYDALGLCTEIERKKIEVGLQEIDRKMLRRQHEWAQNIDWLANAESEHARRPFHAIVAQANPRGGAHVLTADDLSENTPLWRVERERVIVREAEALASAVASLVSIAKTIIFIDPNFSPYRPKARNTLKAFLNAAVTGRADGTAIERVEFHVAHKAEMADFMAECQRQLPQRIPLGLPVRIVRWKVKEGGEGFHNRYILTDRGGIRLAWGLDEGAPAQTDDLSLLDEALFQTRWAQYCGATPAFDLNDEIIVVGTLGGR